MAERRVDVEFVFDRTGDTALAQAYRILVPERRGRRSNRSDHDDCSYLRPSVFGPPEVICCLSDRLARKYAHQALLIEEFDRVGSEW